MPHRYVVTFVGDDRTGIVEQLANTIEAHGGNWLDSRLSQLEGKFAGLILVGMHPDQQPALAEALSGLAGHSVDVRITDAGPPTGSHPTNLSLSVTGPDRPGIVRGISKALADAGINVSRMTSGVESAPWTGETLFLAEIEATAPENYSLEGIQTTLDEIADAMTLDIDIEPRSAP
ncbi:glycine cleavage system regulatory protein [Luminiphilus syltensis NOR5-1B]|uniref:Glycine cleavage system transcriptional repressor n=1 Tax=Luminiphilus syltensis NOR5-1B TaxID=565045 RepID=B8KRR2_9GAMM|nr:ACT domain-containing protein [Luminiphilus syltensis]EED34948.1 glycine cleavage system regulatory protein [Luminiphilus syltensis NOR5-1B]